jgi:uncharacterized membrane protein
MQPRHHEVTRLEGFSDAVFAIALALLVVKLETPKNFAELHELLRGVLPFGLTFAMVCWIWYEHHLFFRRFGLQDGWTAFLNCALLFVILFYVYPLKFVTVRMPGIQNLTGETGLASAGEVQEIMLLYSIGLVLIFGIFAALYAHAYKKRKDLALGPLDVVRLENSKRAHLLVMSIGMLSIAIAAVRAEWSPLAGFVYFLIGPALTWNGYRGGKAEAAILKKLGGDYPTP